MGNSISAEQYTPDTAQPSPVGAVMVVGGGIAGIQAALDLADQGFKVYLVEKKSLKACCHEYNTSGFVNVRTIPPILIDLFNAGFVWKKPGRTRSCSIFKVTSSSSLHVY